MRRVKFIFRWYDFWVGVYVDRPKRNLYILPLPMVGVVIFFGSETDAAVEEFREMVERQGRSAQIALLFRDQLRFLSERLDELRHEDDPQVVFQRSCLGLPAWYVEDLLAGRIKATTPALRYIRETLTKVREHDGKD
jgi:hypothetical protein